MSAATANVAARNTPPVMAAAAEQMFCPRCSAFPGEHCRYSTDDGTRFASVTPHVNRVESTLAYLARLPVVVDAVNDVAEAEAEIEAARGAGR